ncbi:MAG: hypothetical protein WA908_01630 [Pontixanthobacter sp.]
MARKIAIDKGLHQAGFEDRFAQTYLGMAHLAGTGPMKTTCRGCMHWHNSGAKFKRQEARQAYCNYAIPGKRARMVPASAASCRFFSAPPPKNRGNPISRRIRSWLTPPTTACAC